MRGGWNKSVMGLALVAACAATAAPRTWTLVDVGTLGGAGSYGAAISNSGLVAGCADQADGTAHAFVFASGEMRDLGPGCALAVNNTGIAAGRSGTGALVIWKDSTSTSLGVSGDVGGIDADGVVVGAYREGTTTIAFRYADGVLQPIAPPNSAASGINSRGQVSGPLDGRAFLYENGARRDLGTLGGARSSAKGLNDSGQVVGMASDANAQPRSFVFDGAMRALPAPGYSGAVAINNGGQVVGSAEGTHGYHVDGDAYTRLDTLPDVTAKGWRRLEPTGINDRGWIVGTATNAAGDLRAFILVPGDDRAPVAAVARARRSSF